MVCTKWNEKKTINPLTRRKISKKSPIYKRLQSLCNDDDNKICTKYTNNPNKNPLTNRILSETSKLNIFFKTFCQNETKQAKQAAKDAKMKETKHNFTDNILQCTKYETVKLKPHQKHICNYVKHYNIKGLLLFHSVGSGKTITAITILRCLLQKNNNYKIFVLTPTSLIDNFKKEIIKLKINFNDENMKIYSHQTFVNKIKKNGEQFCKNAIILIDEAHNFKTKDGINIEYLFKGTKIASKVILLTATPIHNRIEEFINLYAMISRKEDDIKKLQKQFIFYTNEELLRLLKNKISYFKNEDVNDYPSVTYQNVQFNMTSKYYKLYKRIEDNEIEKTSNIFNSNNLTVFLNGIRRAINYIDQTVDTPKIEWVINYIKKNDEKILIYSNWIKSGMRLIQERLDDLDIKWVEVNGSMSKLQRQNSVMNYNTNKIKIIFISSAGSEGLDLKETRSVIILEPHWNNEKIKQVVGRAVRYKSHEKLLPKDRHVNIYNLILKKPKYNKDNLPSADEYLIKMSNEKEKKIIDFYDILIKSSI